ncbi:hypothetical protein C7212DRAFT_347001 [Tuber magnatum]|uniref:Uncharacterized protein n=1 Tax=Tuber magnatum TaxID=42249 RepID=A0A317SIK4_9PEZI|nr:hypothetical protein C7212DRAFT_347001 [Tuber magnatum]
MTVHEYKQHKDCGNASDSKCEDDSSSQDSSDCESDSDDDYAGYYSHSKESKKLDRKRKHKVQKKNKKGKQGDEEEESMGRQIKRLQEMMKDVIKFQKESTSANNNSGIVVSQRNQDVIPLGSYTVAENDSRPPQLNPNTY